MPYTIYVRGMSNKFQEYVQQLMSALAIDGIGTSKVILLSGNASMNVKRKD